MKGTSTEIVVIATVAIAAVAAIVAGISSSVRLSPSISMSLLSPNVSNRSLMELPTSDGGKILNYAWFESGFLDSSYHSELYYTPSGWWAQKEHIFDLTFGVEDTLNTARRVQFFHDGERKAFAIWSRSTGDLVAKRIMMALPKGKVRRWVGAMHDFPCFVRGFQPENSSARDVLVATTPGKRPEHRNPGELVVDLQYGLLRDYSCLYQWDVESVDLQADRLYESARDLPADAPRTMVSTSADYDEEWRFDLDATLAANPNARAPLP